MSVTKTVGFKGAYVSKTFQDLTSGIVGRDGYLSGAATTDDGVNATVAPYSFVQFGIVVAQGVSTVIPLPTQTGMWFIVASAIDDDPDSGVTLTATADASIAATGTVVAFKANGTWRNPLPVSVDSALSRDVSEPGVDAGAGLFSTLSGTNVTAYKLGAGTATDGRGERQDIVGPVGTPAVLDVITPSGGNLNYDRNDYLVLRKRESGAEIVRVVGNGELSQALGTYLEALQTIAGAKRPSVYAKKNVGGLREAYVWGVSSTILRGRVNLVTPGGAATTLYTGGAVVTDPIIAGQRSTDGALIVVFFEGLVIKVGAFNQNGGTIVDSPVTCVSPGGNPIFYPRAVLDADDKLHIVYQYQDGGVTNNQPYYTKISTETGAGFGSVDLAKRLVNGVNSTKNDTWPDIAVDRQRQVHISYVSSGAGASELGELRYVVLDSSGNAVSRATYNSYGYQVASTDRTGIIDGTSLISSVSRPVMVLTPHDEVNVVMAVKRAATASNLDELAVFNPTFQARLGFPILVLRNLYVESGTDVNILGFGAAADDQGQIHVVTNWNGVGLKRVRLDSVVAPFGVLVDSYRDRSAAAFDTTAGVSATDAKEILVRYGATGELQVGYLQSTTVVRRAFPPAREGSVSPTPHPNDTYLAGWVVGADAATAANTVPIANQAIFHPRPKGTHYPILVGNKGDYQGHWSIADAVAAANVDGGHIVVRSGDYVVTTPLILRSGVRLEGEGRARIRFFGTQPAATPWLSLGHPDLAAQFATFSISGSQVTVTYSGTLSDICRVGDVVEFFDGSRNTTGAFRILSFLTGNILVLDGNPSASVKLAIYNGGIELRNLTINSIANAAGYPIVGMNGCIGGVAEELLFSGSFTAVSAPDQGVLNLTNCRDSLARHIDVSSMTTAVVGTHAVMLDLGRFNTVEECFFGPSTARKDLYIRSQEDNPKVVGCHGVTSINPLYTLESGRTNFVKWANNFGTVSGDANVITYVGTKLSSSGLTALLLEDANTRTAGTPLQLTGSAVGQAAFNGSETAKLVPAVNQRVRTAGDVMTGPLTIQNKLTGGTAALQFADPNTANIGGGVGAGDISLSAGGAGQGKFDGVTPQLLIPSVNERLKKTGGTMTGELELQLSLLLDESATPATPAANKARLFLRDAGGGAQELCIVFDNGLVMAICTSN